MMNSTVALAYCVWLAIPYASSLSNVAETGETVGDLRLEVSSRFHADRALAQCDARQRLIEAIAATALSVAPDLDVSVLRALAPQWLTDTDGYTEHSQEHVRSYGTIYASTADFALPRQTLAGWISSARAEQRRKLWTQRRAMAGMAAWIALGYLAAILGDRHTRGYRRPLILSLFVLGVVVVGAAACWSVD